MARVDGLAVDAFIAQVKAGRLAINSYLSTISSAASGANWATAKTAAQNMEARASAERAWLVAHPAAACYTAYWTEAKQSYLELINIGNAIEGLADAHDGSGIQDEVGFAHDETADLNQDWVAAGQDCP